MPSHQYATAATTTEYEVQTSVELLQALGVVDLCHPTSAALEPMLPLCTPTTSSSSWDVLQQQYSHRQLLNLPYDNMTEQEEAQFITQNIIGAAITVCCVALAAGLFLGLMTLDVMDLRIIVRASIDEDEVKYATRLIPLVQDRHRLLVTLLVFSTLAYETLPIFLDTLMSGWVAVLASTILILVFGEIVPSGIFTGPNQLYLGYCMSPLVNVFMILLYPVAVPLGKVLDFLVPQDDQAETYNRDELSALVRIQHEERVKHHRPASTSATKVMKYVRNKNRHWSDMKAEIIEKVADMDHNEDADIVEELAPPLHPREIDMVEGALTMKTKLAMDVYTPLARIYAVPDDLVLDKATITIIYSHGYSRVPVYRRNPKDDDDITAITGYLITRQLMLVDWEDMRVLDTLPLQRPTCVSPKVNLIDLLKVLQTKGPILTFVCSRPDLANRALEQHLPIPVEAGVMGVITIVDIMESVMQDRLYDERDIRDQNRALATLNAWAATKLQSVVRKHQRKRRASSVSGAPVPSPTLAENSITAGSSTTMNGTPRSASHASESTPLLPKCGDDNFV